MKSVTLPLDKRRILTMTTVDDLDAVLSQGKVGRSAVLITGPGVSADVIRKLLRNGCDYFVCFGPASESMHDEIDDVVLEHDEGEGTVMTTWHDDETAVDVAEFFVAVAGREACQLIAVLDPIDEQMRTALTGIANRPRDIPRVPDRR
jgi:hypothetical protein